MSEENIETVQAYRLSDGTLTESLEAYENDKFARQAKAHVDEFVAATSGMFAESTLRSVIPYIRRFVLWELSGVIEPVRRTKPRTKQAPAETQDKLDLPEPNEA